MSSHLQSAAAGEATAWAFASRQLFQSIPPIKDDVDLSGQTALITGANSGLGFECARALLALGLSRLVLAVRSQSRGDAAAKLLKSEFPSAEIQVSLVDLESEESIVSFVHRCKELGRIDIAILNAGIMCQGFELVQRTRHEKTFQVNYLSTALLALLLIPVLEERRGDGSPARLSLIGSDTAYYAKVDETAESVSSMMDEETTFEPWEAYKTTKLLLLMFVQELSKRVSPDKVIINVPNPGACRGTDFGSHSRSWIGQGLVSMASLLLGRTSEAGARQYVDAVTVQSAESHGSFVSEGRIKPFPPVMYQERGLALGQKLWDETMKELNIDDPPAPLSVDRR